MVLITKLTEYNLKETDPKASEIPEDSIAQYIHTYQDFFEWKLNDISNVPERLIRDKIACFDETKEGLLAQGSNPIIIPRLGINAKILTYLALRDKLSIRPTTLHEEYFENADFIIMDTPIDITCNSSQETFKSKWSGNHPLTLLIPEYPLKEGQRLQISKAFPEEISYAYQFLVNNKFNIPLFLKETISINWEIFTILRDFKDGSYSSSYGLQQKQFGYITGDFIRNLEDFLVELSTQLDIWHEE